jgi:indole-3-glycerol phosphate synthase
LPTILDKITSVKLDEIAAAKAARPLDEVKRLAAAAPEPRDFFGALAAPGPIRLIAEVKKASPSKGIIRADFDPVAIAKIYEAHGATCLSVLTDEKFFQGHLDFMTAVKQAVQLPVLRKDFILDPYQVYEARAAGADAVLLIAECLDDCGLRSLHNLIIELGMTPLVEFYEPANLKRVVEAGASLIGVNNRNLHTFEVDLGHSMRMHEQVPHDCVFVSESGIAGRTEALRLQEAGIEAMLVGESLMHKPDIGAAVYELLGRKSV